MLKREAAKRLKKQQEKDDNDLNDVLGIRRLDKASSKKKGDDDKEEDKQFEFLDRDGIGGLFDGSKDQTGTTLTEAEQERQVALQQARIVDSESIMQRREEQIRKEREAVEKMKRFHDRNHVDGLILPILSLEIVKQFYEDDP